MDQRDEQYLRRAIALAAAAPGVGGRPFGSLLVGPDGSVLAESHNTVPGDGDITAHPELKLARWAARELEPSTAAGTTMYTSCEPCDMCSYAIDRAGLGRVVFALSGEQFLELSRVANPKRVERDGPALFDEARAPIDAFFS
ncbi:tRNA-specific adenosine deaminase [Asanoa ishikariensis]|uniref:tRNA(Arg) A34 adenosine deaminase TadA n=1 Tax=Asanoa ishikariensis TaxID=137265 RepID=A0A1H3MIW9_9ACTN|nr:nucleoside deaminase [Asanoa ishikariensis]GIF66146.1 tRNA-specific adenosine deaminase [Asanoa ishikariensis]SDY76304.1 tRNA(Arg) A34 adenosine deaminase TadA [Asanoa ishikariensis]